MDFFDTNKANGNSLTYPKHNHNLLHQERKTHQTPLVAKYCLEDNTLENYEVLNLHFIKVTTSEVS